MSAIFYFLDLGENSGKTNIECLIYFPSLFKVKTFFLKNKGANITVCNIPCNFFNFETMLFLV